MFCPRCGHENANGELFCAMCGESLKEKPKPNIFKNDQPGFYYVEDRRYSGKAIAGFILSLVGIIVAGIICGTIGIVFSILGLSEIRNQNRRGYGLAVAGLVISIIDVIAVIAFLN